MPTPLPIETFTTKEDKVDANSAADINALQSSIVTIETALDKLVNTDGSLVQGTSFPLLPGVGQVFYRTDLITAYIWNGSVWQALGGSLSNVIFNWTGCVDYSGGVIGKVNGSALNPTTGANYDFLMVGQAVSSPQGVLRSKFLKISGVNTLTIYANAWTRSGHVNAAVWVDCGSTNGSVATISASSPGTWSTFTIDVSGLTNGTVYDLTVSIYNPTSSGGDGSFAYLGGIVIFGS